jgi:putative two-component system response regulator
MGYGRMKYVYVTDCKPGARNLEVPYTWETLLLPRAGKQENSSYEKEKTAKSLYEELMLRYLEIIRGNDESLEKHLKNTTQYFTVFLHEVRKQEKYKNAISAEHAKNMLRAVLFHDIGKMGICPQILHKSSILDFREYETIKTHTTIGKLILDKIITEAGAFGWLYTAREMAYYHHERWDGTGYPSGFAGEEIPLSARILTFVDVYDALTSMRPYKEAFPHEKAMHIIEEDKGNAFDPELTDIFAGINHQLEHLLKNKENI